MPFSPRRDWIRGFGAALLAVLLAAHAAVGWAEDLVRLKRAELYSRNEAYQLLGGYEIQLTPPLEEALQKGVTLTFTQLFEAERPRDYWFPEDVAVMQRALRLSYNALLRQYRVQVGNTSRVYDRLADAITAVGDLSDWQVLDRRQLNKKQLYRARVRMYLDTGELPKPLQINAVTSSRWDLDSGWREWSFKP